jgi:hypothetical protein
MKRIGVIILIAATFSCSNSPSAIQKAVEGQLKQYPESALQDIYKSFFQDEYGPGHLIENVSFAREYFDLELEEMQSRGRHEAEPCGEGKNFVRVPMDLVKDGLINEDDYFKAFLDSSVDFKVPVLASWRKKWESVVKEIEKMGLQLPDFERDKLAIMRLMASGEAVVHHSDRYNDVYDPHYRIMSKVQWEKLSKTSDD